MVMHIALIAWMPRFTFVVHVLIVAYEVYLE